MSGAASAVLAVAGAGGASFLLTGLAVRVALATNFVDHPRGYKGHLLPTPYLGGAAVVCALIATTLLLGGPGRGVGTVLGCAGLLAVIGAVDDRVAVAPRWRVAAELGAAAAIFAVGIHWSTFGVGILDLGLSGLWVVGIVNAFNLMDNSDGAAATVTGVSTAALGVTALIAGHTGLAVAAFAATGACLGFLPHNLSRPARIFLGDGGSMPLGFVVAALAMAVLDGGRLGAGGVLAGGLVAGLPILDTTLVVVSRRRRGLPFVTAGRDHLTHRLLARAGSARRVALLLALGQGALAGLAVAASRSGPELAVGAAVAATLGGLAAIVALESPALRPRCAFERARDHELSAARTLPPDASPQALGSAARERCAALLDGGRGSAGPDMTGPGGER